MKMTSHKITDLLLWNGMQILELMQSSKQTNHFNVILLEVAMTQISFQVTPSSCLVTGAWLQTQVEHFCFKDK